MKIVDTKTEKIYNSAESFWNYYCNQHELCRSDKNNNCPLFELTGDEYDCFEYFKDHIVECQKIMNYTLEEGKFLPDWTIKELKEYCKNNNGCGHCNYFKDDGCMFTSSLPWTWPINNYTKPEKETAKFLIDKFGAEIVEYSKDNENLLIKKDEKIIATVCKEWFPNVTEKTKLSDIAEE